MDPVTIDVQATPNPQAVKATVNRTLAAQGVTYRAPEPSQPAWAQGLLAIPGVRQIFAVNNFISVTKDADAAWEDLLPQVEQVLRQTVA